MVKKAKKNDPPGIVMNTIVRLLINFAFINLWQPQLQLINSQVRVNSVISSYKCSQMNIPIYLIKK